MKYKYIRDRLDTGDIITLSGRRIVSLIVRLVCWSRLSHMGIVVRQADGLYLLESDRNKKHNGVQVNHLGRRIKEYKGKAFVRHLITNRTPEMTRTLELFIKSNRTTSYEAGLPGFFELLAAAIDIWPFHNKPNANKLFCSELATSVFQLWGFIGYDISANEITPKDFDEGNYVDELLKISPRYAKLREPILIT